MALKLNFRKELEKDVAELGFGGTPVSMEEGMTSPRDVWRFYQKLYALQSGTPRDLASTLERSSFEPAALRGTVDIAKSRG